MTITSMTGYGRSDQSKNNMRCVCEIRSLNSRYLEVGLRLPKTLMPLEIPLQNLVRQKLSRGKIEIQVHFESGSATSQMPKLNQAVALEYINIFNKLSSMTTAEFGSDIDITKFSQLSGVVDFEHGANEDIRSSPAMELVQDTLIDALEVVIKHRNDEGRQLKVAFVELLTKLTAEHKKLTQMLPKIQEQLATAMKARILKFLGQIKDTPLGPAIPSASNDRILQEIAIAAEKTDIEEEIVRFEHHISAFTKNLDDSGSVGKRLDFLCQEMHREVNTMSSKLSHIEATAILIELKQLIEQIRQQVQNIE